MKWKGHVYATMANVSLSSSIFKSFWLKLVNYRQTLDAIKSSGDLERYVVPMSLLLLVFFIPISTSGKSITLAIAVSLLLLLPTYRQRYLLLMRESWAIAAVSFFLLALVGCIGHVSLWSEKLLVLEKYSKLLYLPIITAGFYDKRLRVIALYVVLFTMFITCIISLLKYYSIISFNGGDPGQVFLNHIMTSLMMSFACYLSIWFFFKHQGRTRWIFAMLAALFTFQVLFVNTGRTGYFIYLALMLLLIAMLPWKKKLIILTVGLSCFILSFVGNYSLRYGIINIVSDLQHYQQSKDTSVGFRLQFHSFAYSLFKQHPILGAGTAGFTGSFRHEHPIPSWGHRLLEPHSQYWLIISEFGLLGLGIFLFFVVSLFIAKTRLPTLAPVALGLLTAFCVGNFSDSLLFYSATGYFFIILMALCLAEAYPRQ